MGFIWKYLGLKDDPNKIRMEGKGGGMWRGMKVRIIYGSVYQLIV